MSGTLTDMRRDKVLEADSTSKPNSPPLDVAAAVDHRLAQLSRVVFLILVGAGAGAGGAIVASDTPSSPPTLEPAPLVCECAAPPRSPDLAECRLAADYFREAAVAAGVPAPVLEQVARNVLGTPP